MSARVVLIYFIYVKSFIDPAYHSFKVSCLFTAYFLFLSQARCMMWGMVLVKFIIFTAHGIRSVAVIKSNNEKVVLSCFENEQGLQRATIHQGPWNMACMNGVDITLLILSGLSLVGVFVGVFVSKV